MFCDFKIRGQSVEASKVIFLFAIPLKSTELVIGFFTDEAEDVPEMWGFGG